MASMRTIGVRLRLLVGDYKKDADEASASTDKLAGKIEAAGKKSKMDLDGIATGAGIAGAALVALAGAAVYAAANFDKQMSEVRAVSGATTEEYEQLRAAALAAGKATVFSATEAAEAEAELAKAGIKTADILGGALDGSLALASAGSLGLAESAEIAAAAMNTFGLGGDQVTHIADVLAAASNKSAAGVGDLGQGLQQVGLVAAQTGLSLEETVALLAAMADRGLKGSDGATSLKTALMRLAAPTGGAAEAMKTYGISLYNANGGMNDAATIAGQLQRGLKDLAPEQRNAALQTIFGSDAIRAANVLYGEGEAGIREYIAAVDDQGAAARVAETKLDNLAGDVEKLTGSLETLFIESGSGATGGLRMLVGAATDLVEAFSDLPSGVQTGLVVLAGVSGVALLGVAAAIKLHSTISDVAESLASTGPAGERAGRGLQAFTKWGTLAAGAMSALYIATAALDQLTGIEVDTNGLADSVARLGKNGEVSGELVRIFGKDLTDLKEDANLATSSFGSTGRALESVVPGLQQLNEAAGDTSFTEAADNFKQLDSVLAEMVRGGNVEGARAAYVRLMKAANLSATEMEKLTPQYQNADLAAGKAVKPTEDLADATKDVGKASAYAVDEGETLVDLWKRINGGALDADEALLAAKDAIDDVADSFKENGRAIEGNSRAALENRIALGKAGEAAAEAAQAYLVQGGTAEGAEQKMRDLQKAAVDAAVANGGNRVEVEKLAAALFNLPKTVPIAVTVGISQGSLSQLENTFKRLQGTRMGMRDGGVVEHAETGLINAGVYGAQSPARYAFAEPATGGEAFVPKRGNYGRSMSILSAAAGWYNADVVPRGGHYGGMGGGGPVQVELVVSHAPGSDRGVMAAIAEGTRYEVRTKTGGNVQAYYGRRGGGG